MVLVALKYHPDRNPGREVEFNAKFQAIQSAHEVLADPGQRAKYDAERIRAGLLYTYDDTTAKPNVPPRTPTTATNFPPPPRAPPYAPKPAHSSTPASSSTANRYSGFAPAGSWASGRDDAQTRARASKAWEQMKPGQPPHGRADGRSVPPKWPQGSREPFSKPESRPAPRPSWEQFQESYAPFPGMSRGNTSRTPKRHGFVPATPGGDEPQARNTSAYFNVNQGERPQAPRAQTQFPPPPKGQPPTAKKPDAASRFRGQPGLANPFINIERISTPYATGGGERTYFSSSGLNRSSSTRESNPRPEHASHGSTNLKTSQSQTSTGRHHSASPKMRNPGPQRSYSTSSSSSDESVQSGEEKIFTPSMRKTNGVHRDGAQAPVDGHQRSSLNSDSKVDRDVESGRDEARPNVQPNWSDRSKSWDHGPPKQTANGKLSGHEEGFDGPEVFLLHRMKRDAERKQKQANEEVPKSAHHPPSADKRAPPTQPMEKSRSWEDKYRTQGNMNGQRVRAATGSQNGKDTMYDSSGFDPFPKTPSSDTWFAQWPIKSPKGRRVCPAIPPHWATPSGVMPTKQAKSYETSSKPVYLTRENLDTMLREADRDSPDSFTFPINNETFAGAPSLRSQSSENINTTFSPSDWSGKFTASGEYFAPPQTTRAPTPRQRASPTRGRCPPSQHPPAVNTTELHSNGNTHMPPPPAVPMPAPSPSQVKFSAEEWSRHFQEGTFAWPPPPPGSPGRSAPLKRPKTQRMPSKSSKKRPTVPKPASVSATVDDSGEELGINGTDSNVESVSSYVSATSGDGGAMDIDPALTPPDQRAQRSHNAPNDRHTEFPGSQNTPRAQAPLVPPIANGRLPAENAVDNEPTKLNLGDLKNVAPLAPGSEGLKDLGDLSDALPFESRSANIAAKVPRPKRLELPSPPKAPPIPETLTQTSWESYIAQMRNYMYLWKIYDSKILHHFKSRQEFVETSLGANWMSGAGEGYAKYTQGLEEDVRVRMHWNISCEKHQEAMRGLGSLREKLMKSSIVA